jgi:hypothetical protein
VQKDQAGTRLLFLTPGIDMINPDSNGFGGIENNFTYTIVIRVLRVSVSEVELAGIF